MDDLAVTSAGMDFDEISTPSRAAYPICFSLSFAKCESTFFTSVTIHQNGIVSVSGYAGSDPESSSEFFIDTFGIGRIKPTQKKYEVSVRGKNNVKECFDYQYDDVDLHQGGIMKIFASIQPPDLNSAPYLISCLGFQMTI